MFPPDKHLMIDIESMSTEPNAVVLSIGMVEFNPLDPDAKTSELHMFPPVAEQLYEGRHRDPSTLVWWSEQSLEAQIRLLQGRQKAREDNVTLEQVRINIDMAVQYADHIWANGPDFDCVILRNLMGPNYKWPFWKHRCVRTLRSMFSESMPLKPEGMVAHDAIEDCYAQIRMVQAAYKAVDKA